MAQNAPPSQDVQDIQFKIHDKFNIFPERKELKSLVSLLAVSSAKGLLFAGNANAKEFKVIKLRDIVDSKNLGQDLKIRNVPLPGEPKALSCSCDGSMLAINYMLNNTGFLQIYQVDSFLTPNLNSLYNLPVAAESNVFALQLLWNPVIPNNIALILADGSVAMYTLNPGGQYDKVTLSKEHQVKSGCWSPKGKQIVFGFAIGKLQQFKPNLQPARLVACPPGLLLGPFDCIAVHWLSTFQFAVIFLQRGPDMCPSLFIVNAPKVGPATYINYFDICYSAPGPRIQQLSFTHIAQWNLLLVTSANGVEIGILGTREAGETPTWIQYTLLDEARIEMPLTESKDESFPVGFAYDTASSHQVAVGEKKLPVMPMIHVLSTHGHLISFNFLNLSPTAVDVCSPPPPLNDISGQFKSLNETMSAGQVQVAESLLRQGGNENVAAVAMGPPSVQGFGDATFSVGTNMVTSTPSIKDKPVSLYSAQVAVAKPVTGFGFPSNIAASPGTATTTNTIASKPAAGFGFGAANTTVTPTSAASGFGFGAANTTVTPTSAASGFGFGAANTTVTPTSAASGFGFGAANTTVTPTSAASGFGFGAANTTVTPTSAASGFGLGAANTTVTPTSAASFVQPYGNITTGTTFGNFAGTGFGVVAKPKEPVIQQSPANQTFTPNQASNANKNVQVNKPLYTVPSTFTPPTTVQQTIKQDLRPLKSSSATKHNLNTGEIDEVVKSMICIQIEAFETELKQIQNQSKKILENIGSPNELKSYTKQLNDLQEIVEQADDHEFEQDVQSLRHSMNESYAMLAECRTKLDLYNNPNLTRLSTVSNADPINRRQLAKLQAYVASNQTQLSQLDQIIDAQWSQYQDVVRRNSKNQMHIPCLDGIYQRMSKLKDLLSRQRTKMNYIKSKLKQKGLNYKPPNDLDVTTVAVGALTKNQSTMESLADSILSMSLSQVVFQTHAKLSEDKLNAIREFTRRQQQITIIKPKRPDRVGLKSEVILETKLQTEKKQKEMAKQQQQQQIRQQQQQYHQQQYHQQQSFKPTQQSMPTKAQQQAAYQMQLQQQQQQQQQQFHKPQANIQSSQYQQQPILAKPTASKPSMPTQPATFITPTSSTGGTLSFGGNSSFVKTSTSALKSEDITKPSAAATPFQQFSMSASSSAGLSFGQPKPLTSTAPSEGKENIPTNTPISFSAKVIGGNDAKSFASLGNKSSNNMAPQGFAAPTSTSATTNQGFTAFSANKSSGQEKEIKKSEDATRPFDFSSTITCSTTSTAPTSTPAFGGFSATSKPSTSTVSSTSGAFTTPSFGSTSNASTTTPFGGISSSSNAPFAASSSFSFNTTSASSSSTIPAASITTTTKTVATTSTPLPATSTAAKTEETKASSTATSATSTPTSFNTPPVDNTTFTSTKSSAAPNVAITSSGLSEPKPASATATSTNPPTSAAPSDPTDSLFGSLNVCKPNTKESADSAKPISGVGATSTTAKPGAFSFATASGAGDGATSFLGSTPATTTSSGFSFGSTTNSSTTESVFGKPTAIEGAASTAVTTITTTSTINLTSASSTAASTTTTAAVTTTATSFSFGTTPSTTSAGSLFGSLSLSSTTEPNAAATTTATAATDSGNIFGGAGSSIFGQSTPISTAASTTSTTTSIFGGGAAAATSGPSLFGSTAPATAAAATPGTGSIFAATAAATSPQSTGSIFAGIPKPDQSVFGSTSSPAQSAGTGIFAAAAATTKPPAATGASIFGGGSTTGFGAPSGASGGSIFGGGNATSATSPFGSPASAANTASSIFGAAAAASKPVEGGNIFGSPTQQSAASGGSIFGQSTFGQTAAPQSSGSIFGGAASQSPTAGGFGASGGSIFGGNTSANNSASGGSIFGGAAAATASAFGSSAASPGFGSFSQPSGASAFGSPTAGGFGAPASTGFGSPQQQSAFAKPVFGGPATFGTSPQPAFGGAQPTFGGAPTFGSPKGFGTFTATSPTAATGFGAAATAAPKGNIFETLGSQDTGLSFGNLAHSTQPPQQKPTFGGSSFTSYRS